MMTPSRRRFLTQLAALPFAAALPLTGAAQAGRQYRIELVIFEHQGPESRAFLESAARPLAPNLDGFGIGEGPIRPSRVGFELDAVANRIEGSGSRRVLARLAWDQLGRTYAATSWMRVQEGDYLGLRNPAPQGAPSEVRGLQPITPDYERYALEGRLRVWVGHYLHLETDLIHHVPHTPGADPERMLAVPVRGSQRMASGEDLFYLDHPTIGIIARVTRIDT